MREYHLTAILESANIPYQDTGVWGALNDRPLEYATIAGQDAFRAWQAVREVVSPQSHPLVLPRQCYPLGQIFPQETGGDIQKTIAAAEALNLSQWWSDRWEDYDFDTEEDEFAQWLGSEELGDETNEIETFNLNRSLQEKAGNLEAPNFAITRDQLSLDYRAVWLTLFPEIPSWQILAYLQYGGWNACPLPEEHAAVLAYWHRYYGAELFGMDETTLELWVREPPATEVSAFALAKEQFAYCDDIVSQGTMTVARLAEVLRQSSHWYFWWD